MSFTARPAEVEAAADALRALSSSAAAARRYAEAHLDAAGARSGAFFFSASSTLDQARVVSVDAFTRLGEVLRASARELDATARLYRETDEDSRARLDAAYPGGGR